MYIHAAEHNAAMRREEAGLGFLSSRAFMPKLPPPLPRPLSQGTHHYGTNHRAFDHPPQRSAVIHIPAAERRRERSEVMLRDRAPAGPYLWSWLVLPLQFPEEEQLEGEVSGAMGLPSAGNAAQESGSPQASWAKATFLPLHA